MGMKESFLSFPDNDAPDLDCYWSSRAAIWGVNKSNAHWIEKLKIMAQSCPKVRDKVKAESCDLNKLKAKLQ